MHSHTHTHTRAHTHTHTHLVALKLVPKLKAFIKLGIRCVCVLVTTSPHLVELGSLSASGSSNSQATMMLSMRGYRRQCSAHLLLLMT